MVAVAAASALGVVVVLAIVVIVTAASVADFVTYDDAFASGEALEAIHGKRIVFSRYFKLRIRLFFTVEQFMLDTSHLRRH